jgi:Fic family protein
MLKQTYAIPSLPPPGLGESVPVLKEAARAHRYLAELKGRAASMPNPGILINTLALQEAKASSEIENIVTTQDELFQASLFEAGLGSPAAKEVARYSDALHCGFDRMTEQYGILSNNSIVAMFQILKRNDGGFRETPGTALKNDQTQEIVYVPPQTGHEVRKHMGALESYINDGFHHDLDPLIKMAIIHHQFESIHPFPDGNGRIGRIINVLYLVQQNLLDIPILYLSGFITRYKSDYYRLLQHVRETGEWEPWLLYMLRAVGDTSVTTLGLVNEIDNLMATYKHRIRKEHSRIYSQELLNNLFAHPYTRIEFVQRDLGITRQTASRHLDQLSDAGLLVKHQSGRSNYYINAPLIDLFQNDVGEASN